MLYLVKDAVLKGGRLDTQVASRAEQRGDGGVFVDADDAVDAGKTEKCRKRPGMQPGIGGHHFKVADDRTQKRG